MSAHIMPITGSQHSPADASRRRGWFGTRDNSDEDRGWLHDAKVLGGVVAAVTPLILLVAQVTDLGVDDVHDQTASAKGSIAMVAPSLDASKITVAGTAEPGVNTVMVRVGSLGPEGQGWARKTEVFAQEWKMVIPTAPKLVGEYEIEAWYYTPSGVKLAASQRELASSFMEPPPPPNLPGDLADCVAQYGDVCFQGQPGWSDPSVYRSGQ